MRPFSTLRLGIAGGLALAAAVCTLLRPSGAGTLEHRADSLAGAHAAAVALFGTDTLGTDSAVNRLPDSVAAVIKGSVHRERKSAVTAIKIGEDRVKNLQQQLRIRDPRLQVFGRVAVTADPDLLEGATAGAAQVGLELRLGRGLHLQAYAEQPLAGDLHRRLGVAIQKDWRLY